MRRWIGLTVLLMAATLGMARPAGANPAPPSAVVPCPPVVGCNPIGRLAGDGAKAAAASAARATFDAFTGWVADGASAVVGRVGALMTRTTDVRLLGNDPFGRQFELMRQVGILIVLPMLLAALIGAIVHRDPSRLGRAVGLHLPLAILGSFVAVELTAMGLEVTDFLCGKVAGDAGANLNSLFQKIVKAVGLFSASGRPDVGGFLPLLGALVVAAGALLVWVELLLRASAIYVAVMFLPVALAGLVWPATSRWAKRLIELLAALVLSKFVIVAVLSLAVGLLASGDGVDVALSGGVLLLLAGFAPFVLLRLVPVVEAAAIGHLEGIERRPIARLATTGTQLTTLLSGHVEATAATTAARTAAPTATVGGELERLPVVGSGNGGGDGNANGKDNSATAGVGGEH